MRYPSIACTKERFDHLLCWIVVPDCGTKRATYETVDWNTVTPEEMNEWREQFTEMQLETK